MSVIKFETSMQELCATEHRKSLAESGMRVGPLVQAGPTGLPGFEVHAGGGGTGSERLTWKHHWREFDARGNLVVTRDPGDVPDPPARRRRRR